MVDLSTSISEKIRTKQGEITEDEVADLHSLMYLLVDNRMCILDG